jgi:DNA processing protein
MFGLKEADVAALVRAVAGDQLDRDAIRECFARATWTGIAEPGDRVAGLVVEALGAGAALDGVVARWPAPRWSAALGKAGAGDTSEEELHQAMERWRPRLVSASALRALSQAARFGARLLRPDAPGWPEGMADLGPHAPIALWVRGTDDALAALSTSIALVGARAATGYGEHVAMEAAAGLVDRGYAIVSGAAFGIDGMAHRAALASHGHTVAFLAGGVDRFYPSAHDALLTRIVEEGAVISELPCGQPPTRWRFLQRNRLIAAASQATVVVEAGARSGALNTASHALTMGRAIGAVPGPVTSPASVGCHRLLRDSTAMLVTTAEEMAELAPRPVVDEEASDSSGLSSTTGPSPDQTRTLDALSTKSPRTTLDIAARSGLSVAMTQSILGGLELDGRVAERERGWVKR